MFKVTFEDELKGPYGLQIANYRVQVRKQGITLMTNCPKSDSCKNWLPCVVASCTLPTGNMALNPGMCPDWESNW